MGEIGGSVGEAVGGAAGVLGGMRANAAAHGMPEFMLVGVTADGVYGFEGRSRSKEPSWVAARRADAGTPIALALAVSCFLARPAPSFCSAPCVIRVFS